MEIIYSWIVPYIHLSAAGSASVGNNTGSRIHLGWKGGISVPKKRKKKNRENGWDCRERWESKIPNILVTSTPLPKESLHP